ncbi:MAG: PAS domain S-box protein [Chloroflexi bacterium]|uniref:histidine kinase n=1 Tax=Candidatus Chlorohelix allophototropha TaxID=3003348 RepID=A0A8T7M3C1_9CHLR|nr:PAS domain S-box protein [Chloroflexota bacterium]WJW65737.1 PAS domain S-box protein [Chloroflexota bacterium L227-S17]
MDSLRINQLATILDRVKGTFFALDTRDEFVFVNQNAANLFRRTTVDLIGKNIWQELPELQHLKFHPYYRQAVFGQKELFFEEFYPSLNFWFEVRISPSPEGTLVYLQDITEYKLAQLKLKDVLQYPSFNDAQAKNTNYHLEPDFYQNLVSIIARNMAEGVMLVRHADSKILYANPRFEQMFGYGTGELIGQSTTILNYGDENTDAAQVDSEIRSSIQQEEVTTFEVHNVKKDGSTFWSKATISLYEHLEYGLIGIAVHEDITEQKKAEQALRENEERYRLLADTSLDLIFTNTVDGTITYLSPSCKSLLGYEPEELLGKSSFILFHPDDIKLIMEKIKQTTPESNTIQVTYRCRRKDGSYIWVETYTRSVYDPVTGKPLFASGVARDITERKKAELALLESEARYRTLAKNFPNGAVLLFDKDLRYTIAEGKGLEVIGLTGKQLVGKTIYEILTAKTVACLETPYRAALAGNETIFEMPYTDELLYQVYVLPVRNENNEITGGMVVTQDITEQRQMQNALAAETERLAITLRSIGDGVVVTDNAGNIVLFNRAAAELTGWSIQNATGKQAEQVLHLQDSRKDSSRVYPIVDILEGNRVNEITGDIVLLTLQKQKRNISFTGTPLYNKESKLIGAVLTFLDVTEKIYQMDERMKIRNLESLGTLAGGLAHNFNNVLTAIMGNISLVKLNLADGDENQEYLEAAEKATFRAKDLAQQLLTFAKGGSPIKEKTIIKVLLEDTVPYMLRNTGIRCEFNFDANTWSVVIDQAQITQAVQSLVQNAIDSMPHGGLLQIATTNVSVDSEQQPMLKVGNYVLLTITDQGSGIKPEELPKIFDPYYTTKFFGKGLGLPICYSIIKKHEGHISIESELGKGTRINIYLPAALEPINRKANKEDISRTGLGRILIVDDEVMVSEMLAKILQKLGYQTYKTTSGEEALETYRLAHEDNFHFNAVIADLSIKNGMGARELIPKLLQLDPKAKVIVSSGYLNDPVMTNYRDYGFAGCINKPFSIEMLDRILREITQRWF